MEPQVFSDCEANLHPSNTLIGDGDCGDTPSPQNHVALQQPVKKQTRQWAAWTRQEEESFFTALRQVGKNFEKITCRVQSKNKDQVRHYYYRLVRRMNKLLGPEVCLDARNSKDTNAAMLRWWSLLEKYSCKASKLHLKPRRFKIFIETLEDQLLKDRKKTMRKRRSPGENGGSSVPTTVSSQNGASGNDTHAIKVVILDGKNMQKVGSGKGSSFRRNVNVGVTRSNSKGDSSNVRTMRQRQKSGMVSTAAYKRWEKAVIAGVSLVADAAEHLERAATDKDMPTTEGETGFDHVGDDIPPRTTSPKNIFVENTNQTSVKLKLQLFPVDEGTRRALELDNHNPHLELTLSTRKKISSVLDHLNRKWGNSSIASGELMLFPYFVQRENLVGGQRWAQDSILSAADVYASIGSPPVFRLRYGWFSSHEPPSATFEPLLSPSGILVDHTTNMKEQTEASISENNSSICHLSERLMDHCKDQVVSVTETTASVPPGPNSPQNKTGSSGPYPNKNLIESSDHAPSTSLHGREAGNGTIMRLMEYKDNRRLSNGSALSAGEWADSLTNISVGDLLSEAAHDMEANSVDQTLSGTSQYTQQSPFSCDSFDAAIAAHISRHQSKNFFQPPASSIWDAEETCDAFSFQKNSVFREEGQSLSMSSSAEAHKELTGSSGGPCAAIEELPEVEGLMDDDSVSGDPEDDDPDHADVANDESANGDPMDACQSDPQVLDNSVKDFDGLTDMYWPDSLGPLDLDIPSCRYHSEDLILSDSLSGLNRLIASSLDAFQNCAFFSSEKKEASSPSVEAQVTSSFSDYKVGSQV